MSIVMEIFRVLLQDFKMVSMLVLEKNYGRLGALFYRDSYAITLGLYNFLGL